MSSSRSTPAQSARSGPANRRAKVAAGKLAAAKAQKLQRPHPMRAKASSSERPSSRAARAAERRQAIVAAGLDEFIARGFTAARLDDVAKRAGVAKGTIYLHFKDKEALFQELVRTALVPLIGRLTALPMAGGSARAIVETFAETFLR